MKTVKINESSYELLNRYAGEMRYKKGRPISINEALSILIKKSSKSPLDFAGTWDVSEMELDKIKNSLKEMWKEWEIR